MKFSYTKIASTIFAALLLPACGGGSSSSPDCQGDNCGDTPNPPVPDVIQYDLKVNVQDYADKVDDAVVCIDMNDDNVCSNVATNANVSTNANEVVDIGVVKTKNGFVTFKVTSEDNITGKNILAYSSNKSVSLRAPISKEDLKDNQVNEFFVTPLTDVLSKYIELSGKNAKNAKKELADTMGISVDAFNKSVTTKGSALNVLVETLDVLDVAKAKDAQEILQKTTQSFTKIEEAIKNDVKPEQIVSDVVNNSEKENPFEDVRTEPEQDIDVNQAPVAKFIFNVKDNGLVEFSNQSEDVDGDKLTYIWNFGDNSAKDKTENPAHVYANNGKYVVELLVSDGKITSKYSTEIEIGSIQNAAPTASFSAKVAGLEVTFKNTSTDPENDSLTYSWNFGDQQTSTEKDPVHVYKEAGTYTVTLVVNDGTSDSKLYKKSVEVVKLSENNAPEASFAFTVSQLNVTFVNNSSDADGDKLIYMWKFGDGETSTEEAPKHTYEEAGTYEVSLTVSDGQIEKTTKKNVVVNKKVDPEENVAPVADFTAKATGLSVAFKNNSSDEDGDTLEYSWDFGDGKTSTAANPTYKYAKKGTYDVVLTVTDGKEKATKKLSVTVNDGNVGDNHAPVVDFYYEFMGLDGFVMSNVTDEDGDNLTYHWDFGDGNTSDKMDPTHKYATGGEKVVTLTVSDGKETVSKTYKFTLQNVEIVKPTKNGIYYNGNYTHIYVWRSEQDKPFGAWPGKAMDSASESSAWKFVDTSSLGNDKINLIFNGGGQTGDIKGVSPKGCYKNDTWIEYDQCTLSDQEVETISGGKKPVGNVVIGDIPWYELDYDDAGKGLAIASDISGVQSAPFVTTNLAPGSHYTTKTLELRLEDADRRPTSGTIYYTLDNSRPTESSTKYTGPITLEDTSEDGLGTAYRLRVLVKGDNGMSQEQSFFWFFKKNKTVAPATDFRDETIYFVLPARYYDGDKSNNYHCRDRFDPEDPSWRGDFKGLIEKLDYIKGMGFTAIWVTPPVENRSGLDYHGYHAYDWFQTDLRLESPGATYFDLIKAAHKKGIKIVQDVVLNHSSNYGIRGQVYLPKIPTKYYVDPQFGKGKIDNGPYQGTLGDYNSINRCDNDNPVAPTWHRRLCAGDPDALATFTLKGTQGDTVNIAGVADKSIDNHYWWNPGNQGQYLPSKWYHNGYTNNWESVEEVQHKSMAGDCVDLKTESKHVQNYMNSALNMYIDMGIDAVRIDTLKHMPREEVISMVSTWQAKKPGMFVFGEALIKGFGDNTPSELLPWYYTRTSSASSKSGDSGISVLDFSLMSTFRDNVSKGGLNGLADVFNRFDNDYADATKLVTFFQNHDLTPDNTWSGAGAQHCCTDRKNSALAYNVLWTVRGIPVMYAGDETGARVGLPPDLTSANDLVKDTGRLYIGDSLDNGDPIIGHITDLNAIRKSSKALQRGKLKVLNGEPLIFERIYENERAIVAIVGSGGGNANVSGATDGSYVDVVTGQKYTVSGGSVNLGSIPGSSMRVLIKDYSGGKVAGKSEFLK